MSQGNRFIGAARSRVTALDLVQPTRLLKIFSTQRWTFASALKIGLRPKREATLYLS
jgi:hypothetical protein